MTDAALRSPSLAGARAASSAFASVEICEDFAGVGDLWRGLEAGAGAYQTLAFLELYARAFSVRAVAAVARDARGEAVALLPLEIRRRGPVSVGALVGGGWANYHMGLFRPGVAWERADVAALLRAAGRAAGVDLFAFTSQPASYEGRTPPLSLLAAAPGPSPAFATALGQDHAGWLDARLSKATQKKMRKKWRKLETFGPVSHVRASGAEARPLLDAFHAHKAAQALSRGEGDLFATPPVRKLLDGLLASGAMEMHALVAGERIAATFAALPHARRLSGLVISYDGAAEIAAASPGEWLVIEAARDAIARGFATLDLGVGDARYKREMCEIEEPLADLAFPVTALGRAAGAAFLAARAAKGFVKRRPGLYRLARRFV